MDASSSRDLLLDYDEECTSDMEKSELAAQITPSRRHNGLGVRHLQAAICFTTLLVSYLQRVNLSVGIVQMNKSEQYKIDMSPEEKALMLSSFFWGYCLFQIFSGSIGRRGYAVILFSCGNFFAGIFALMLPLVAINFGFVGICITRFMTGLVQGCIYPNLNNIMANWAIPQERDVIMCIIFTGPILGTLICMSLSGYLGYCFDWPSIFYATGCIAIIWGLINAAIGSNKPESHKWISEEEREFMKQSFQAENKEVQATRSGVPWKQILMSRHVIALTVTTWCSSWSFWVVLTLTPTYINGVLNFNLQDDGLVSSLPYLFSCLSSILLSFVSGVMRKKTTIPDSFLRFLWNTIGMYGVAASLVALAFAPASPVIAITLLVLAASINVCTYIGHSVNHLDLSPNFAGVLMSVTNSTATTAAILGPLISTTLIRDSSDVYQWRLVFQIAAVISFIGSTVFLLFGSTKKQAWDEGVQSSVTQVA